MKYALIDKSGRVENVIEWDGETEFEGCEVFELVPDDVGPGFTRDGTGWQGVMQPLPEPPTVQDVKDEAARRLAPTDWQVLKSVESGDGPAISADLRKARALIRERSNEIEALDPIPADYRDEKYWR